MATGSEPKANGKAKRGLREGSDCLFTLLYAEQSTSDGSLKLSGSENMHSALSTLTGHTAFLCHATPPVPTHTASLYPIVRHGLTEREKSSHGVPVVKLITLAKTVTIYHGEPLNKVILDIDVLKRQQHSVNVELIQQLKRVFTEVCRVLGQQRQGCSYNTEQAEMLHALDSFTSLKNSTEKTLSDTRTDSFGPPRVQPFPVMWLLKPSQFQPQMLSGLRDALSSSGHTDLCLVLPSALICQDYTQPYSAALREQPVSVNGIEPPGDAAWPSWGQALATAIQSVLEDDENQEEEEVVGTLCRQSAARDGKPLESLNVAEMNHIKAKIGDLQRMLSHLLPNEVAHASEEVEDSSLPCVKDECGSDLAVSHVSQDSEILRKSAKGQEVAVVASGHFVKDVSVSSDGRSFATCGTGGHVAVWDADNCRQLRDMYGHTGDVVSVAWSPKDKLLATASETDGTVRLWHVATADMLHMLETDSSCRFKCVAWSPDGKSVCTGSMHTHFWDVSTGALLRAIDGDTDAVLSVAWNPDGSVVATGSSGGIVRVLDVATGETVRVIAEHSTAISGVSWSPDGTMLALCCSDCTATIWDVATCTVKTSLKDVFACELCSVSCIAWSPNGRYIATSSDDGHTRVWDAFTGSFKLIAPKYSIRRKPASAVAWSPCGGYLFMAGREFVCIFRSQSGR